VTQISDKKLQAINHSLICIAEHDQEIMAIRKVVKTAIIPKLAGLEGFKLQLQNSYLEVIGCLIFAMQELIDLTEINIKLIPVANLESILNIDSQKLPKNLIKPKA
jgi:hypothetical protein